MTKAKRNTRLAEEMDRYNQHHKPRPGQFSAKDSPPWIKTGNFEVTYQAWTCATRYVIVLKEATK